MKMLIGIVAMISLAMLAANVLADTTLRLENKDPTTWVIYGTDGIYADLTFNPVSPTFKGTLTTYGLGGSTEYALIYKPDTADRFTTWTGVGGKVIAIWSGNAAGLVIDKDLEMNLPNTGDWNINPSPDYCLNHNGFDSYAHCKGAKLWIVPTSDLTSKDLPLTAWNPSSYLFETDLITYVDRSLSIGYATVYCTQPSDCSTGNTCVSGQCVPKVCGMTATGSIFFGDMVQGTTVQSADTTTVTNTGNIPVVTPTISGDYWYGTLYASKGDGYWMPIGATQWYVSGWNTLTSTLTSIGTLASHGDSATVYYKLTVPAQQVTDTYSQAITFTAGC